MDGRDEVLEALAKEHRHLHWEKVRGADSWVGLNSKGEVVIIACGRREPDPVTVAQDLMESGSQETCADDEYA